jgi:SOS-response transcriptional repressor LexA
MFERSAILDHGVRVVDLTSTERALLRACEGLIDEDPQGRRPPLRQIAMRVGLAPSTVYGHFKAMKAKGAVTWQPRKPCTLEILIDLDSLPLSSASLADTSTSDRRRLGGRPSPGSTPATADVHTAAGPADGEEDQPEHTEARNGGPIAAGEGVVIDADLEQIITVPGVPRKAGELIAFHVQGQSMTGAGIFPGDLVVVRVDEDVEDGELVAAELQSEITDECMLTVKRLYMRDGIVRLMPANPDYGPIDLPFRIVGRVITVLPADRAP